MVVLIRFFTLFDDVLGKQLIMYSLPWFVVVKDQGLEAVDVLTVDLHQPLFWLDS